jgi:hypothetical protein
VTHRQVKNGGLFQWGQDPGRHPWLGDRRVRLAITTDRELEIAFGSLEPVSRRIGFLLRS